MKRLPISDPIRTTEILHHYHLYAKKGFGQNFLVNPAIIAEIVTAADIQPGDQVVEVGPGIGALSEQLLQAGAKLLAYEIDDDLIEVLAQELADFPDFKVLNQDVLQTDLGTDLAAYFDLMKPIKVVANLPYYITTPILFMFIESKLPLASLTVMMQKEVGERIIANPGSKDFGPLSIAIQTTMDPKIAFEVSPRSFNPAPKVDSVVVTMTKKSQPLAIENPELFDLIVKTSFAMRRKTIYNNLKVLVAKNILTIDQLHEVLATAEIPENKRAEQLGIPEYLHLTELISAL